MTYPTVELFFNGVLVAIVRNCYYSDYTWYGSYELATLGAGEVEEKLRAFVVFSEEWNYRLDNNPTCPPSASEFSRYSELMDSTEWWIKSVDGTCHRLAGAPGFLGHRALLWRMRDNVTIL